MRVRWLAIARADLLAVAEYVAQRNPATASALEQAIRQQVGRLADHPRSGRPGRVEGTRELVVSGTPYIVAYRVMGEVVTVLRVLRGARR